MGIVTGEAVSAPTASTLTKNLDRLVKRFHAAPLKDEGAYLFLDGVSLRVRRAAGRKRVQMQALGSNCWSAQINYGFKNDPDVPAALQVLRGRGCEMESMATSYFLSRDVFVPSEKNVGMAPWRQKLFAQMHHNAAGVGDFLLLPSNSLVELGSKVEV